MSSTSGITASPELTQAFSDAVSSRNIRFIKVSIENELLVHDQSIPVQGKLEEDLSQLQSILLDSTPAYILARIDTDWLFISYVPDSAPVRSKMLFASTRAPLLKSLGSALFTDSIFATTRDDLTAEAYSAHRRHINAPKPMSEREKELESAKIAEGNAYEGSRVRVNHIGAAGVGLKWNDDVEQAVRALGEGEGCAIVILAIENETLTLHSSSETTPDQVGFALPASSPSYAFLAYPHTNRRDLMFIYSCPSSSPIKHRMIYSSASSSVFNSAKALLPNLVARKIETSDPKEVDEKFLVDELGLQESSGDSGTQTPRAEEEKKAFAKPKGPARRNR